MTTLLLAALLMIEIITYMTANRVIFDGYENRKWLCLPGMLAYLALIAVVKDSQTRALSAYAAGFLVSLFLLDGNFVRRLIKTVIIFCIASTTDALMGLTVQKTALFRGATQLQNSVLQSVFTALLFIFFLIVRHFNQSKTLQKQKRLIKGLSQTATIGFLVLIIATVTLLQKAKEYFSEGTLVFWANLVCVFALFSIVGIIINLINMANTNAEIERLLREERSLDRMKEEHYQMLLKREEDTRRYRHDLNNHLHCLRHLIRENRYDDADQYIDQMSETFNKIVVRRFSTGHDMMDALLNYYFPDTKKFQIVVNGKLPLGLSLSDYEVCTIFSNLFRNAVEEVSRLDGPGRIELSFSQNEKFTGITMKNSSDKIFRHGTKALPSQKDGRNHGFGLKNIDAAVHQHHGIFEMSGNGNEVVTQIKLPNSF